MVHKALLQYFRHVRPQQQQLFCEPVGWSALVAAGRSGGAAPRVFVGGLLLLRGLGGFLGLGFASGGVASSLGRPTLAATGHGPDRHLGGQDATEYLGWE